MTPRPVVDESVDAMRIRIYSNGKFYLIECPGGTRIVRCARHSVPDLPDSHDSLVVPFKGQEIAIPAVENDSTIAHCDYCGCDFGLNRQP